MKKQSKILGFILALVSTQAFSLIDGQLLVGFRNGALKGNDSTDNWSANELVLSAHVDPIPLVPVAFGLSLVSDTYQDKGDLKGWTSFSVIPEVMRCV